MNLHELRNLSKNERIAIIGLGKENLQFLEWLLVVVKLHTSHIILADKKDLDFESIESLSPWKNSFLKTYFGPNYLECLLLDEVEYVFKAPGIWSLNLQFEEFRARKGSASVMSSLVFFMQKFRDQIVGVTGTKGKSTTSSLVNHLLPKISASRNEDHALTSVYCGNTTGISPYQFWTNIEQEIDPQKFFVIELSSFQLQDLGFSHVSPKFGIITNYYVDHQDQHATAEEYWEAKDQLFLHQEENDLIVINDQVREHSTHLDRAKNLVAVDSVQSKDLSVLLSENLRGTHNQMNAALAMLLVETIVSRGKIFGLNLLTQEIENHRHDYTQALESFKGLPHRQELVWEYVVDDFIEFENHKARAIFRFIDDGFATESEAVVAGIESSTSQQNHFMWLHIAGVDKGANVQHLIDTILRVQLSGQIYRIDYCGDVGKRILQTIYDQLGTKQTTFTDPFKATIEAGYISLYEVKHGFLLWLSEVFHNLDEIGEQDRIRTILEHGEVVLNVILSPGGSSFDEFNNYVERANWWVGKVQQMFRDEKLD